MLMGMVMFVMMFIVVMMMMVVIFVRMLVRQVDIELHSGDARLELSRRVQVVSVEPKFLQLMLELVGIDAQID